jgi:rod shape-determining protein MreD
MRSTRGLLAAAAVAVALLLQVSVLPHLSWRGVVPDLCLLVVVAAGLAVDARFAMLVGFGAGLLLDLAPPADHVAGRWALALVVVGYVAGLARQEARPSLPSLAATIAVCSVVGGSLFALSGMLLGDLGVGIPGALTVVGVAAALDVVLGVLLVPVLVRLLSSPEPSRVLVR